MQPGTLVLFLIMLTITGLARGSGQAPIQDGLVLYLDAATQVAEGGPGADNALWKNLAADAPKALGDAVLKHLGKSASAGWTGTGSTWNPYALRFDAATLWAEGPGDYTAFTDVTLEAWALVEGAGNNPKSGARNWRAATLITSDFGMGGLGLLISSERSQPMLLGGRQHVPVAVSTPLKTWLHIVLAMTGDEGRLYVNGEPQGSVNLPRSAYNDPSPGYLLGCARQPKNDFVEADGLKGELAVVRIYDRALSGKEIAQCFQADAARFGVKAASEKPPVFASRLPSLPGLAPAAPARAVKWDYYAEPPAVSGTAIPDYPGMARNARQAFDGYPQRLDQAASSTHWEADLTKGPAVATINYKRPVVVTRFVHIPMYHRCFRDVDIETSEDGETWRLVQRFEGLAQEPAQVLGIDKPAPSRFYRLVVKALTNDTRLMTQEIETWYGTTLGNVTSAAPLIQSEPSHLRIRVASPDVRLEGARLRLIAPAGTLQGPLEAPLPSLKAGETTLADFALTPLTCGPVPLQVQLLVGDVVLDEEPAILQVASKLALSGADLTCAVAEAGQQVKLSGMVTNAGATPAIGVKVKWLGKSLKLGDLVPGEKTDFSLTLTAKPGFKEGRLVIAAEGQTETLARKSVLCAATDSFAFITPVVASDWQVKEAKASYKLWRDDNTQVTGALRLLVGGQQTPLVSVGKVDGAPALAAAVPGAALLLRLVASGPDACWQAQLFPSDPNPTTPPYSDFELRLAVDKPKVMFRPHIDWYTIEEGPNYPALANGHNSATRMLAVETDSGTLSLVPDTDNMTWGFSSENELTIAFHTPLAPPDALGRDIWQPIEESPLAFSLRLSLTAGDWWEAYRYVVKDVFDFEQPRQWALPVTQMQLLTTRYSMRPEVWSEKYRMVRSHPGIDFFYNFYGVTYNIPALYGWYLVTEDTSAKALAEREVEWLLEMQEKEGPLAGAWFSMYCVDPTTPSGLIGLDQAWNRWCLPHATGTTVKTLLWYWEASGKGNSEVFTAAVRGAEWLLATQRPDGAWTYAFDLQGKPVSEQSGAGQIWCTWSLWKLWEYTGDERYKLAAQRSRDAFKRDFMDQHRYMGYWEDVSGAGGSVARSWEAYEPAIACLVFAEMGDNDLALWCAKDAATWSWTRVTTTRQPETSLGETTEQSLCGPSQAQSPMTAVGMQRLFELTGDPIWEDFSGAMKAVNFSADPDQAYGMVATSGWGDPLHGVASPPYENYKPFITPNNSLGDEYGRQVWNNWCTDQFAWLALEWLVREGNLRAPKHFALDINTYRGTVLGQPGRVRMPEEKCDLTPIDHLDINWVGYENADHYALLVINHKEQVTVAVRPHEAHLGCYSRPPQVAIGAGQEWQATPIDQRGLQYFVTIPAGQNALFVWDKIK